MEPVDELYAVRYMSIFSNIDIYFFSFFYTSTRNMYKTRKVRIAVFCNFLSIEIYVEQQRYYTFLFPG